MKHSLELVSSFLNPGVRAGCSCGWEGPDRNDDPGAYADFERHLTERQATDDASEGGEQRGAER